MEQLPPVLENTTETSKPAMSLAGRLFNVFATPGEVFEHIKRAPVSAGNWIAPALLTIVVSWVGVWLIFSQDSIQQQVKDMANQAIDKQVEKGKLTQETAEERRPMAEKATGVMVRVGAYAGPVFIALLVPFWGGLIVWLVGTNVFKADYSYLKGVEVAGICGMVNLLDAVVRPLLILITGSLFASPSLALLVPQFDPQNSVHGLLAAVNVMTFWALALRATGLSRLTGCGFGKAAAWIFGIWAGQTGFFIGLGFLFRKAFGQ